MIGLLHGESRGFKAAFLEVIARGLHAFDNVGKSFSGVAGFVGHIFRGGFKQMFGITSERSQIERKPFSYATRMRHFQNGGLGCHEQIDLCRLHRLLTSW